MNFPFDHFDQFEVPNIALANPDLSLLYNLGTIYDRELKIIYHEFQPNHPNRERHKRPSCI